MNFELATENDGSAPLAPKIDRGALTGAQFSAHDVAMCSTEEARTFLQSTDAIALNVLPLALVRGGTSIALHVAAASDTN